MIKKLVAAASCIALALCLCGCTPTYKGMVHDVITQCQPEKQAAHIEVTGYMYRHGIADYEQDSHKITFFLCADTDSIEDSVSVIINNGTQEMADSINNKSKSSPITVSGTLVPELTRAGSIAVAGASVL